MSQFINGLIILFKGSVNEYKTALNIITTKIFLHNLWRPVSTSLISSREKWLKLPSLRLKNKSKLIKVMITGDGILINVLNLFLKLESNRTSHNSILEYIVVISTSTRFNSNKQRYECLLYSIVYTVTVSDIVWYNSGIKFIINHSFKLE